MFLTAAVRPDTSVIRTRIALSVSCTKVRRRENGTIRLIIVARFAEPIAPKVECTQDAECASKLACFNGVCRNPCVETKPCGANAECSVVDTLPLRTMTCLCLPGYLGDADISCRKGESTDESCVYFLQKYCNIIKIIDFYDFRSSFRKKKSPFSHLLKMQQHIFFFFQMLYNSPLSLCI